MNDDIDLVDLAYEHLSVEKKRSIVKKFLQDQCLETTRRKAEQMMPREVLDEVAHKLQSFMDNGKSLEFSDKLHKIGIEARTRRITYRPSTFTPDSIMEYADRRQKRK